jgi:hypothetical protein
MEKSRVRSKVARLFLVQLTKTGKIHQITKWYQMAIFRLFQISTARPSKNGIFGKKKCIHSGNPGIEVDSLAFLAECNLLIFLPKSFFSSLS